MDAGNRDDDLLRQAWQDFRTHQEFEHLLIDRKTSWLLTTQGLLLATYAITLDTSFDIDNPPPASGAVRHHPSLGRILAFGVNMARNVRCHHWEVPSMDGLPRTAPVPPEVLAGSVLEGKGHRAGSPLGSSHVAHMGLACTRPGAASRIRRDLGGNRHRCVMFRAPVRFSRRLRWTEIAARTLEAAANGGCPSRPFSRMRACLVLRSNGIQLDGAVLPRALVAPTV